MHILARPLSHLEHHNLRRSAELLRLAIAATQTCVLLPMPKSGQQDMADACKDMTDTLDMVTELLAQQPHAAPHPPGWLEGIDIPLEDRQPQQPGSEYFAG